MQDQTGLRILDLAAATQANIGVITNLGHRLYSDDILRTLDSTFGTDEDAALENQSDPRRVAQFFEQTLDFPPAHFDGALVWDSLQFLASPLLQAVVAKLHRILRPGASLLALFHTEERIESIPTFAYRVYDHRTIQMMARSERRPAQTFNNRSLEKLFQDFQSVKFFLTRDRLREVIVRR